MSENEKNVLAEALNYVDQDYIAEYEGLSTYTAAKKAVRRRRLRLVGRVAACLAIVGGGVFLTVSNVSNNGSGINRSQEKELSFAVGDKNSEADNLITDNGHGFSYNTRPEGTAGNGDGPMDNGAGGEYLVSFESLVTDAPDDEILVYFDEADRESITLVFCVSDQNKGSWYTGAGMTITELDKNEVLTNDYSEASDNILPRENNDTCSWVYSWSDSIGELSDGRYMITTYISDGNKLYKVNTVINVTELR